MQKYTILLRKCCFSQLLILSIKLQEQYDKLQNVNSKKLDTVYGRQKIARNPLFLKAILLLFGILIGHVTEQLPNTYILLQKKKDNKERIISIFFNSIYSASMSRIPVILPQQFRWRVQPPDILLLFMLLFCPAIFFKIIHFCKKIVFPKQISSTHISHIDRLPKEHSVRI